MGCVEANRNWHKMRECDKLCCTSHSSILIMTPSYRPGRVETEHVGKCINCMDFVCVVSIVWVVLYKLHKLYAFYAFYASYASYEFYALHWLYWFHAKYIMKRSQPSSKTNYG